MTREEAMRLCPHLLSPAHLAIADSTGKWKLAPHLRVINDALVQAWLTPNSRTAITVPFNTARASCAPCTFQRGYSCCGLRLG